MRVTTIQLQQDVRDVVIYSTLVLTIFLIGAFKQHAIGQTQLGFRGGINISEPGLNSPIGNTNSISKAFTGIDVGIQADTRLGQKLSLLTELGYNEKGIRLGVGTEFNALGTTIPIGVQTITKIRMIELPVFAKYNFTKGKIRPFAMAGPSLGYALNGQFKTQGTLLGNFDLFRENFNLGDQNRLALGWTGGLGFEMDQGNGTLFMDARYANNSLKIRQLPIDGVGFRNNGVAFNLGYKVRL